MQLGLWKVDLTEIIRSKSKICLEMDSLTRYVGSFAGMVGWIKAKAGPGVHYWVLNSKFFWNPSYYLLYLFNKTVSFILQLQCILQICYSGLIYRWINKTIIWYDSGLSRIPPITPQFGVAVGFDLVGKFIAERKIRKWVENNRSRSLILWESL